MTKKRKIALLAAVAAAFIAVMIMTCYRLFFSISAITPGKLIDSYDSPHGKYQLCLYLNDEGATGGYALLGVIYMPDDDSYARNIYWQDDCDSAEVEWTSESSVVINGIEIDDVQKDTYDFRVSLKQPS